jgi:YhcH/YjgK/YiaL family protein
MVYDLIASFMNSGMGTDAAPGRYDLGQGCYVNVDEYDTRENLVFEGHRRYVDVQLMVDGDELIHCAPLNHCLMVEEYSDEKDVAFYRCEGRPYATLQLRAGMAAVLKPWDLHAPCNRDQVRRNRKLVFKIPVELVRGDERKVVACCGDSITFGLLATSADHSYPSVLQEILGDRYRVENFGRNGATVIADYPLLPNRYAPYLRSPEYAGAMLSEANIVVLMLGMNDGNPTHHFNADNGGAISDEYLQEYSDRLKELIRTLQDLPGDPQILLATTTAMRRVVCAQFDEHYIRHFTENMIKIRQLQCDVAGEFGLKLIDTLTQMDDPAFYRDGCHLTDAGYRQLASIVGRAIETED